MKHNKLVLTAAFFLVSFVLWTILVQHIDIAPIGPLDSSVGFAVLNRFFHNLTGVHMNLYILTDLLEIVPIGLAFWFATLTLLQWITRKKLRLVAPSLLVLMGFYASVVTLYVFFELFVVNYRPILIENVLEASYPSSTTLLVITVMPTAMIQLIPRIKQRHLRHSVSILISAYIVFMVISRLISGVHWISDIIGSVLLGVGLVMTYVSVVSYIKTKQ